MFLLIGCQLSSYGQFYNGTKVTFGQNRIQYQDFEWQYFRFQKYETYFYTGGLKLAKHTSEYANQRIEQVEHFLDYYLSERIQFIIFNNQSQFRQSNIGLSTNDQTNIGGTTNIVGTKIFLYFDGDYGSLEKQIDAGILRVLINQMIYGGNWREVLRNSAVMSMPDWYIEGLISYLVYPDNPLIQSRIRDGIVNNEFKKFNSLGKKKAIIAGHSMWAYIAETYGQNVISNILYMTKISREIDDGFLYVIGLPFEDLYHEWADFYAKKYGAEEIELSGKVPFKIRKNRRYQNFKESKDGRYLTYTTNQMGKYKIYLYDKKTDKRKKIFVADHKLERLQDYSYPIVNFHPSSKLLTFITEKKNEVYLYQYNIEEKDLSHQPILKLDKVLSFDYNKDGRQMIFSAMVDGQSDLYLYNNIGNTQKKLTDDKYADLSPVFSSNEQKVFFISDRPNDALNQPNETATFKHEKDVFEYDLNQPKTPIHTITDSPKIDESSPIINEEKVLFLQQTSNGSLRYEATFDSAVSAVDTTIHYRHFYKIDTSKVIPQAILEQSIGINGEINQISYKDQKFQLYTKAINQNADNTPEEVEIKSLKSGSTNNLKRKELKAFDVPTVASEVNINEYQFTEDKSPVKKGKPSPFADAEIEEETLTFPTQRIYRLNFSPDNSVLQLNNMFITSQYQQFNGGPYINPGLGVSTKIGIVDLMEDQRIYGGFRYSGNLIEYSLNYQDLSKRLDKEYSVSRRRLRQTNTTLPFDVKTLKASSSFIWPFNEVSSLHGVAEVRNDKNIPLSSSKFNLERPITNNYWGSIKAAFVFDNTRNVALNIKYGTRYRIFAEQYQLLYDEGNETATDLTVFGFDFRHYQKIHREFIGVFRVAGSKSIGSNPLIYYLGGVDEWWKSDIFDNNTPIDYSMNYGFQALAANMRGFLQNVRNGNNFVVVNTELRMPIFSYLINRPIQSDLIRNFQIVGFGDIGTAWVGASPFSEDNPIKDVSFGTGPVKVTYKDINNPIVGGVGFGVRTTLLGYFVRLDWGWGIENGEVADKPLFMLSLSLDI